MNPLLRRLGGYPLARFQDLKLQLAADGTPAARLLGGRPRRTDPRVHPPRAGGGAGPGQPVPDGAGLADLRGAIADWVARRSASPCDPATQVVPTAGSKEAIFHIPLALVDPAGPKRAAIWGDPGYPVYGRGQQFAGGVSDPVRLTPASGWRLELGDLDPARLDAAAIAWVNHPHNPTGATADLDYYYRRARSPRARAAGVVLGSDECYVDVHPEGAAPPSLLQAADGDLTGVLVAFSLSKRSGMTGYRSAPWSATRS